ncbi:FecR domain-containing protein [Cupriavidus sp. WKF15]|uniref:FecR domain-containing protein n=1 Tax=Cupriavidus sp. WKF15 TaxID=3032282 RepID=UPI0023E2B3E2|nr:FecR domain-containing protein [Cupriavidus sp. WKF15]WER49217.1 FecR domain-containing protein [Cupriavidus sp. WKF15]
MALAMCLAPAAPAQAGPAGAEGADFIYVVEPGDNLFTLAERYMASADGWRLLQARNGVADPHRLAPGTRLRIPLDQIPEQPGAARVVFVNGPAQADGEPLRAGLALRESARIVTAAGSTVTLELPDRTRVTLPPGTTVAVRRLRTFRKSGLTDTVIGIERGQAESRVAPGGGGVGRFELHTPMMVTGVRGTRYRVAADTDGSRSEVLEGQVGVALARAGTTSTASATAVTAGYGIGVAGARLSRPVALLPAPSLQPLPDTVVGPATEVAWQPVQGAAGYRVSVARDAAHTELVWTGDTADTHIGLEGLPEGPLYLAVSAVDAQRLSGKPASAQFAVRLNPPAPFTLQPGAGTVRYGDSAEFEWAAVGAAASYELAVSADAGFAATAVTLQGKSEHAVRKLAPGAWLWRVRSLDARGRPGPWSAAVPFTLEPAPPVPSLKDDGNSLRIGWPADASATAGYRVQMAEDSAFTRLVADQRSADSDVALPRPPAGTYYVRVARAAADGQEPAAAFSAPQRIDIAGYLRDGQGGAIRLGNGVRDEGGHGDGVRLR